MKMGASHKKQVNRLNRIAGQVNGVVKMVEDQRYCIDILTQIKAIKSALTSVERQIVDEHLNHCVHKAINSKKKSDANEMMDEIKELLKRSGL
ncbi:MAG: hypothetical protein CL677_07480 [Bdellovibrionaceae bacterium]|nr:hypothetical protein [Pseudobdellovibrionaceae bacterium]